MSEIKFIDEAEVNQTDSPKTKDEMKAAKLKEAQDAELQMAVIQTEGQQALAEQKKNTITSLNQIGVDNIKNKIASGELDMNEAGKQAAHLLMTSESLQDTDENQKFRNEFKKTKQEELLASADKALAEEEAKKLQAKRIKAEEFYKSFRPILEMDLSPFLHNDNPQKRVRYTKVFDKTKNKMVKVPIDEVENSNDIQPVETPAKKVGYEDRSYGIPFMVFILLFLTVPYLVAALVLSVFNIINSIFVACSKFSKPAFIICASIASIVLIGLFLYVVLLAIQGAFHVQIIPESTKEIVESIEQISSIVR